MALRNLLDGISTDGMLRRLVNNLNFTRDSVDRLRVVVDTGGSLIVTPYWANQGSYIGLYGQGAMATVDAREQLKQIQRQNAQMRRQRWTIS